ncbi:MAG: methionyl aminopeptidase [SAR324 cluster bacterium]|nr:methionyl aminopeptidase [SAR324 cluster bacterium]MEE1575844.1 methionyl aminopeptidase [Deltaproteobacteria bacterium]MDP7137516.1 methionyl aminopeptidase [SAR324 cluster bacterium]MDP7498977.1 methionyl aminopeptidase [SAR324 cluster bacterium]HJL86148.1 methionyl aminopeptidase [SAR324 cluster bacterium]
MKEGPESLKELSRNDPCWCGSGKKFKKCHLGKDQPPARPKNPVPQNPRRIMIKTEEQLEGIRRSSILTRDLLDMLEERIQVGVTTNQINEWVHEETLAQGADPAPLNYGRGKGPRGKPFPKSVCTSINEVICHGIPNERILADGDIINVDVTCNLDGYFGDASRMFIIGEIPDSTRELVEETKKCLELGIAQVRPGGRTGDIGYAIQNHAESLGYSVVRDFCGHGVGVEFHEAPQILHYGSTGSGDIMQQDMVFTIEPMINMGRPESRILGDGWTAVTVDGSLSAQWEHTIHVTAEGYDVLTG